MRTDLRPARIWRPATALALACLLPLGCAPSEREPQTESRSGPVVRTVREDPLAASVSVAPTSIAVGESIGVVLLGEAPPGWTIELPEASALPTDLETLQAATQVRRIDPATQAVKLEQRMTVTSWSAGEVTVPGLVFEFVSPAGERRALTVPEIAIAVESLVEAPFDPQQLAGLRELPPSEERLGALPWLLGGVFALGALAVVLWLVSRNRRPVRQETPEEWAHAQLAALAADDLPGRGQVEPFFVRLIEVVRGYLRRRLGLERAGLTSDEFLRAAVADPRFDAGQRGPLDELLRFSDLIKFAKAGATQEECDRALEAVRRLVESLRPAAATDVPVVAPQPHAGREQPAP